MEARALLSHVALTRAIIDPDAVGHGTAAVDKFRHHPSDAKAAGERQHVAHRMVAPQGPLTPDEVEVNGQVEIDPGDD
jgi:hypothetical protein